MAKIFSHMTMSLDGDSSTHETYRPSWVQRQASTMLTRILRKGRGPSFMRLLSVPGRRTGIVRKTPVVPVFDGGGTWVVSPFGEVAWVRNARAWGRVELQRGTERTAYAVRELDPQEAVPVLRRYLTMPSRFFVRRHFDVSAKATDAAIAAEAERHPVFGLTPVR
jgi:deazaflavin-dependent oxidoreductase (nitroreductase family)